jgi:c-di-GMP-binding flagellar brake protein YcgR
LHELQAGDKIRVRFDYIFRDELKKLEITADIIASRKLPDRSVYEHRAEFSNITKNDREDLIKYIFEQERRLRRNDKI